MLCSKTAKTTTDLSSSIFLCRLIEFIFSEGKLYLVFEHVDKDLKKYMVATDGPLKPALIKV